MKLLPCFVCGEPAELPAFGALCLWCAEIEREFSVVAFGRRLRCAFHSGDRAQHRRALDLLIARLRVEGEAL